MPTGPARSHRRAGRLALLVALCLLGSLTSCAPDPSPGTPPPSAGPTAAPTPSLPAPAPSPTAPPEMTRDDEAGAVAAVTFFLTELYPYTVSTQDTAAWDSYSAQICKYCVSLKDSVLAERAAGQSTRPGHVSITSRKLTVIDPLRYRFDVELQQGADVTYTAGGAVVGGRAQRTIGLALLVVRNPGQWLIGGMEILTVDGVAQ